MSKHYGKTLTQHIIENQRIEGGSGTFSGALNGVIMACKRISSLVDKGELVGVLGNAGSENVQGEDQKLLDIISNETFIGQNEWAGHFAGMASEEMEDVYQIPSEYPIGKYLIAFDPLDGSSNIDVNISVGTIFSILRCPDDIERPTKEDFLQPGTKQICAGYCLYGSATMMVLTMGNGVNGYTLDKDIGAFILTHPDMTIPEETNEFSINMSNMRHWEPPVKRYIDECLQGKNGARKKDFNMRWVASMVADVHRLLVRGGIFLYPYDAKAEARGLGGKLRLIYEANPISFIVEQAGGLASTGEMDIMNIKPSTLHQRVPVVMGSRKEVQIVIDYHKEQS